MKLVRRSAKFEATLVYVDEPQLICLMAGNSRILAVAIPEEDLSKSMFLATTVSKRDWEKYIEGVVDLRYLFTYPTRVQYTFDLYGMVDGKVMMNPVVGDTDGSFLPLPGFFSSNHTEDYDYNIGAKASDVETLLIDGEWELTDFGQFQQKFSDIYAFLISTQDWTSQSVATPMLKRIKSAFLNRPFQGGFSYVHLFRDLNDNVPRSEKLNLSKIQYASPGSVEIYGRDDVFDRIHEIIPNFLQNRIEIGRKYSDFYKFLSRNKYLQMSGDHFSKDDAMTKYFISEAEGLSRLMMAPDFDAVWQLTDENALVASKVVLSFYRRLAEAATYFGQGRIAYEDE